MTPIMTTINIIMNYRILEDYPLYEVYSNGKVIRKKHVTKQGVCLKRKELVHTKAKNGYETVKLRSKDGNSVQFYVHRLVWMAWVGEIPKGYEIDHLADRSDNNLDHLRMVNHKTNCNNPSSIKRYRESNSLDKGKFNRDKMIASKGVERDEELRESYMSIYEDKGNVGIWYFMRFNHIGYPRAVRICKEMQGKVKKMGASAN
jgi:hypothetical protein